MTSYRQIEANRRNALKSTGPRTETGKQVSRCNAVRHGLTAETVLSALEDAEDYKAFEAAITADYDAQSAVERELVLRLASILWRLRRATTMERFTLGNCMTIGKIASWFRIPVRSFPQCSVGPNPPATMQLHSVLSAT
jgi:hypothetical protein